MGEIQAANAGPGFIERIKSKVLETFNTTFLDQF